MSKIFDPLAWPNSGLHQQANQDEQAFSPEIPHAIHEPASMLLPVTGHTPEHTLLSMIPRHHHPSNNLRWLQQPSLWTSPQQWQERLRHATRHSARASLFREMTLEQSLAWQGDTTEEQ